MLILTHFDFLCYHLGKQLRSYQFQLQPNSITSQNISKLVGGKRLGCHATQKSTINIFVQKRLGIFRKDSLSSRLFYPELNTWYGFLCTAVIVILILSI